MKHVSLFLPVLLAICLTACNNVTNENELETFVSGEILNPKNQALLVSIGDKTDTLNVDEGNLFDYVCKISEPTYLNFKYRRQEFFLYLYPGDSIHFSFDPDNSATPLEFSKGNTSASEYLMNMNVMANNSSTFKDLLYETDIDVFIEKSSATYEEMRTNLESFSDKINDEEFITLENKRLDYLFYNLKFLYNDYFLYFTKREGALDSVDFFSFATELNINDEASLPFKEYIDAINNRINYEITLSNTENTTYEAEVISQIEICSSLIESENIKEAVNYNILMNYGKYNGFDAIDSQYQSFINSAKDKNRISKIQDVYNIWAPLKSGNKAPDFSFPNEKGEKVSLSDLQGKLIYIDVWATWCGPCRMEVPYFAKLESEYRNKEIVFLSVSVDDKKDAWIKFLEEEKPEWPQLHTGGWDCSICKDYYIKGIPRFILIDKNGKIIDATAPRPSSDEIKPLLNKLLGSEV